MTSSDLATPRDVLAGARFFSEVLDGPHLDALAAKLHVATYPRGARLIREDDLGTSMFVIASGEADITVPRSARIKPVATLRAGDIYGEMSLLTGERRAVTVTAKSVVTAVEIPKPALSPLIAASPELADRFARILWERQAELDRIYTGNGRWKMPGSSELANMIRGFFGGTV